ncbi:galactose-1-phosphate uridylyltransferase [Candidatus Omnitrophota bacterium]
MSELRQDPTTREWVIVAPERAKRPQQRPRKERTDELQNWDESCPFCPGNETETPDEVFRIPIASETSGWAVRVVPNRFAALTSNGNMTRSTDGPFFRKRAGIGVHEVIIESPSHNIPLALMPYQQVENVVIAYQERYNALKKNHQLKFITIFKNHKWASGTSLAHPHSQLVATPIPATYYHLKSDVAADYCYDFGSCLYCDLLTEELQKGERIVAETKELIVLNPYASRVPYETWIIPKRHYASFGLFPAEHLAELAMVIKDTLFCLYHGLDNPAFNLMIDTATTDNEMNPCYHWHIKIIPRLTLIAGFEMGSGIYITTALPEETARSMKKVANSFTEGECPSFTQKS